MKRGLSSVVTTILLISLAIVIIGIVFIWNKQILSFITGSSEEEQECSKLNFALADVCYEQIDIFNINTKKIESKLHIQFNTQSNLESQKIESFLITLFDKFGNTKTISSLPYSNLYGVDTKTVITDFISDEKDIYSIKIAPQIIINNKNVICKEKIMEIKWGEIKLC